MLCQKCNAQVEAGERVCGACGAAINHYQHGNRQPISPQPINSMSYNRQDANQQNGYNQRRYEEAVESPTRHAGNVNKKLIGAIAGVLAIVIIIVIISASGGGFNSKNYCYYDDYKTPTKQFVTSNGTIRYYCKDHVSQCAFCSKKATKNYTNLLDFHVFVCNEHYREMTSQ